MHVWGLEMSQTLGCLTQRFPQFCCESKTALKIKFSIFIILFHFLILYFFKIFYLFVFRESEQEGEREGEKHQCVVASCTLPTGNLAHNPGMCPDWESNQ